MSKTMRMLDRFKRDVRLKDYIMSNSFDTDDETPKFHIKKKIATT